LSTAAVSVRSVAYRVVSTAGPNSHPLLKRRRQFDLLELREEEQLVLFSLVEKPEIRKARRDRVPEI
jgi:hypothetical protein